MSLLFNRHSNPSQTRAKKSRRPTGISRRRKRQLGFETLEDRRVMSAQSPVYFPLSNLNIQSYSSNTLGGELQVLANELYWQSLMGGASNTQYASNAIPSDPLLNNQWHLINMGQQVGNPDFQPIFGEAGEDIGVAPVWNQGIFGNGVVVGVFELGQFQAEHPDLFDNVDQNLIFTGAGIPTDGSHATAVAGLIGAVANNGIGGSGVAPGATLVPMSGVELADLGIRFATDNGIDIVNNSWGPFIDLNGDGVSERGIAGPSAADILALRDSVREGRDGKGVIYVFSSGNDAGVPFDTGFASLGSLDSATYNGWISSRYTIGVTGVDHDGFYNNIDGTVFDYAEAGPNVLVAAPTGSNGGIDIINDTGLGSGIWTTDLTEDAGYNQEGYIVDRDFLTETDYTSRFNGTSASAPLVSGVIALMLEANPELSWRDVQEILVRSARQNAEFDVPTTGATGSTQNTWIINQTPLFHDPDPFFNNPGTPDEKTMAPILDPLVGVNHYAPTPQVLTNGSGYTVSQGRGVYGEEIGYAHGVVDADLAVKLAQQWSTKNQALAGELTYTNFITPDGGFFIPLPAQEQGNQASGFQVVPGGLGGDSGFIAYWNEYYAEDPFSGDSPPANTRGIPLPISVPADNTMSIENVEVKFSVTGGNTQFLQNVRVALVSPDGTHHELNDYFLETPPNFNNFPMNVSPAMFRESGMMDTITADTQAGGPLVATFSSNRSWGERSDDKLIFDPTTKEPINGLLLEQGWSLVMENYSNTSFEVTGIEVAFHGNPISSDTYRLQGVVGVDDDQNNDFNFSRVLLNNTDSDGVLRFGEVTNDIDFSHESMASNVTVVVRRASDNAIVDQFVTGADGNYYFDLVPDDYIISVEDPLGRTAIEDTLSPDNILQHFRTEWTITSDFFKVWDYDSNLEAAVDPITGVPLSFGGTATPYHVKDINFLLDPGPPVAPQVQFSGVVIADLNGDGLFNGNDVNVPNATVFADVNRNGQLDSGEQFALTNASGQYNLVVGAADPTVVNIGVVKPADWTFTNPATGVTAIFGEPGDSFTGVDLAMQPPLGVGAGNGTSQGGFLIGNVYEDVNNNGTRQTNELGVPNTTVFIDVNNNGTREVGEPQTTTNVNGAYIFANVAPGIHRIRVVPTDPLMQINPGPGVPRVVTLAGGGTVSQIEFGIGLGNNPSGANLDFGDLPAYYGITLLSENGARHGKSAYFLGSVVDVDIDGNPSPNADGDDLTNFDDDDGIVVDPLIPGAIGHLVATASRHGGNLQAWFDFNDNGVFEASEKVISDRALLPGPNDVTFQIPANMALTDIYARFRYGEYGIDSVTGPALIGEVEDYLVSLDPGAVPAVIEHGPDFDEDGDVDGRDFLAWQRGFGKTSGAAPSEGDSNSDGKVDGLDLQQWQADYGTSTTPPLAAALTVGEESTNGQSNPELDAELPLVLAPIIVPQTSSSSSTENELSDSGLSDTHSPVVVTGYASRGSNLSSIVSEVSAQESTLSRPSQRVLQAVANEVEHRLSGSHTPARPQVAARLEAHRIDQFFEQSSELAEIGLALREGSHQQLAGLHRRGDHEQLESRDELGEDAFDLALSEEVLWRAM